MEGGPGGGGGDGDGLDFIFFSWRHGKLIMSSKWLTAAESLNMTNDWATEFQGANLVPSGNLLHS